MCVHVHVRAPKSTVSPTHLHGLLQVLAGFTEAVAGEVLHNCVYRPTHLEGTPYKATSTDRCTCEHRVQVKQSEVGHVARTVGLPLGSYIYTNNIYIYTCAHTHVCSLAS